MDLRHRRVSPDVPETHGGVRSPRLEGRPERGLAVQDANRQAHNVSISVPAAIGTESQAVRLAKVGIPTSRTHARHAPVFRPLTRGSRRRRRWAEAELLRVNIRRSPTTRPAPFGRRDPSSRQEHSRSPQERPARRSGQHAARTHPPADAIHSPRHEPQTAQPSCSPDRMRKDAALGPELCELSPPADLKNGGYISQPAARIPDITGKYFRLSAIASRTDIGFERLADALLLASASTRILQALCDDRLHERLRQAFLLEA